MPLTESPPPLSAPFLAFINNMGSLPAGLAVTVLTGISLFGSLELLCSIFFTSRRYRGKYFYCMLVASLGVGLYLIFSFTLMYSLLNKYVSPVFCLIDWTSMVTGQALVLHSRLHLTVRSQRKLRWVLMMIIVNAVIVHGTQSGLALKAVQIGFSNGKYKPWVWGEKISVTIFTIQETIISGIYLLETLRFMKPGSPFHWHGSRRVMKHLVITNIFIIAMDIVLLTFEWAQLWGVWCGFKGLLYSVKLKVEFRILNQLKDSTTCMAQHASELQWTSAGPCGTSASVVGGSKSGEGCAQSMPGGQSIRNTKMVGKDVDAVSEREEEKDVEHEVNGGDEIRTASRPSSELDFVYRGA